MQKRTFDKDSSLFLGIPEGGPPGYDSAEWQLDMMKSAEYYKIISDADVIGGFIVFGLKDNSFELGRIYIDPIFQNKGYGKAAMNYIFDLFPEASKWILDTPSWAVRNQYFYEKLGFVKKAESDPDADGHRMFFYERGGSEAV